MSYDLLNQFLETILIVLIKNPSFIIYSVPKKHLSMN